MNDSTLTRRMAAIWWPLFPLFCGVVLWSAQERLIAGGAGHAGGALRMAAAVSWMAGAIYVLGWAWVLASCVRSVSATGEVLSNVRRLATAAQPLTVKTILLAGAVALDQLPAPTWRWILQIWR